MDDNNIKENYLNIIKNIADNLEILKNEFGAFKKVSYIFKKNIGK